MLGEERTLTINLALGGGKPQRFVLCQAGGDRIRSRPSLGDIAIADATNTFLRYDQLEAGMQVTVWVGSNKAEGTLVEEPSEIAA